MTIAPVSRRRSITAGFVLAALVIVAAILFLVPRPAAVSGDSSGHANHGSPVAQANPPADARDDAKTDGVSTPIGGGEQATLVGAASTATGESRDNSRLGEPRAPVEPTTVLDTATLGGCTIEYGETGQCLSVYPPSLAAHVQDMIDAGLDPKTMPHDWTCDEVRRYFPTGIAVRQPGVDPQALDDDGDAMACEPVEEEDPLHGTDD